MWLAIAALVISAPLPPITRIAFVPIVSAEAEAEAHVSRASLADAASAAISRCLEARLLSQEELFVLGGEAARLADCGANRSCIASRARALGIDRALVAAINVYADPPLAVVELLDAADGRVLAQSSGPADSTDLAGAVRTRIDEVITRAGCVEVGRLALELTPADAHVSFEHTRWWESGSTNLYLIEPGRHHLSIDKPGFTTRALDVEIRVAEETRAEIVLEEQRSEALIASPWFWVVISAAVAAGITVAIAAASAGRDTHVCLAELGAEC